MTPSWTGLHPGSSIATGPGARCFGGVTLLLSARGDGAPTHLITAGHLFPRGASGEQAHAFASPPGEMRPRLIGHQQLNLLDGERPQDLALIELTEEGVAMACAGGPTITGLEPSAMGQRWRARLWLSNKQRDAGPVWVRLTPTRARFSAAMRPDGYVLRDILMTSAPLSRHGDSGSPLLTTAERGRALGLLVGRKGVHGVFEPLARGIDRLQEMSGLKLRLCRI